MYQTPNYQGAISPARVQAIPFNNLDYRVDTANFVPSTLDNVLQRIAGGYHTLAFNLADKLYNAYPLDPLVRDIHDYLSLAKGGKKNREARVDAEKEKKRLARESRQKNASGNSKYAQKQGSSKQRKFWEEHSDPEPEQKHRPDYSGGSIWEW